MAKFCSHCGSEIDENAVICVKCGCAVNEEKNDSVESVKKAKTSLIFGILGIVFAWLFAIIGHVLSIIGIVVGIKEYKATNKMTGLILSIIGEVCAIFSSIIGAVIGSSMFQ